MTVTASDGEAEAVHRFTIAVAGNFHGPAHEEARGAFDTSAYVGAFGAKRQP